MIFQILLLFQNIIYFCYSFLHKQLNSIEQYFNQIKHYLRLNIKVLKYDDLVIKIKNAIKQVKKENHKNYFENAYNKVAYKDYLKKDSTLKRKLINYKD